MAKKKINSTKVPYAELYETTEYGVFTLDTRNRLINEGKNKVRFI